LKNKRISKKQALIFQFIFIYFLLISDSFRDFDIVFAILIIDFLIKNISDLNMFH